MEIAREGCIEALPSLPDRRRTRLAPFVDPCYRSRPVTGRNGQGFTTLPPSGPQEGCLGPTNSPTANRVVNYSIREANFLPLTFTLVSSDQPRGRCEESLVDSCCLPSYQKQESCFGHRARPKYPKNHPQELSSCIVVRSVVKRRSWSDRRTRQNQP